MCDTVVRITDAGIVLAKNSDRDPGEAQGIEWHPAADHGAGEMVHCTWLDIPQVPHTYAIAISRPWWMWGAEMGSNEYGLTIGNEAVFTRAAQGPPALLGMDMVRLALERASDVDQGLSVLIDLLERYGQGGSCSFSRPGFQYHNSFLLADPQGAAVLETAGNQWAVEHVSGPVRAISNELSIPGFAQAHADKVRGAVAQAHVRSSRMEELALQARDITGFFTALRDHGQGNSQPRYAVLNGAMCGPCVHPGGLAAASQTAGSWVADLRDSPVHWVTGTAAPCTSLFFPIRVAQPAQLGSFPGKDPDDSMWWLHEELRTLIMRDPHLGLAAIREERDALETEWHYEAPETADVLPQVDYARIHWLTKVRQLNLRDQRPVWARRREYSSPASPAAPATPASPAAPAHD